MALVFQDRVQYVSSSGRVGVIVSSRSASFRYPFSKPILRFRIARRPPYLDRTQTRTDSTMAARVAIRTANTRPCIFATPKRSASIYTIGEGWTGALGTGRFDQTIVGHHDEEDAVDAPIKIFHTDNSNNKHDIESVAVGWGHTAIVSNGNLLLTGRPHDFSALLRLRRSPKFLRDYATRRGLQSAYDDNQGADPTSLVGRFITWLSDSLLSDAEDWDKARELSILASLSPVELPHGEIPVIVKCSAGLTAVLSSSGRVYTFGLNAYGQCGVGFTSNNVWKPQRVVGLEFDPSDLNETNTDKTNKRCVIDSVELGLQHALCLDSDGQVFAFGKGDRGQLGQEPVASEQTTPVLVSRSFELDYETMKPLHGSLKPIKQISAGMIHSAALDVDNMVWIWGKNVLPAEAGGEAGAVAADAKLPVKLRGLPNNLQVLKVACGSHHTAVLLEDGSVWAVGVSSDTKEPIHEPVIIIPPGIIELPVRQFECHMDRTTVVGKDGRQVLQVHLWRDAELQQFALFTPLWVDQLMEENPGTSIRSVHRGWIHTAIITD